HCFCLTAPAPTETHALSLHDALPICAPGQAYARRFSVVYAKRSSRDAGIVNGADPATAAHGRIVAAPRVAQCEPRRSGTVDVRGDRKSTRLNSSHLVISYAVFCLKKK